MGGRLSRYGKREIGRVTINDEELKRRAKCLPKFGTYQKVVLREAHMITTEKIQSYQSFRSVYKRQQSDERDLSLVIGAIIFLFRVILLRAGILPFAFSLILAGAITQNHGLVEDNINLNNNIELLTILEYEHNLTRDDFKGIFYIDTASEYISLYNHKISSSMTIVHYSYFVTIEYFTLDDLLENKRKPPDDLIGGCAILFNNPYQLFSLFEGYVYCEPKSRIPDDTLKLTNEKSIIDMINNVNLDAKNIKYNYSISNDYSELDSIKEKEDYSQNDFIEEYHHQQLGADAEDEIERYHGIPAITAFIFL